MWDLLEHKFSKTWKEEVKARELMRKEMQQSVRQKIAPKKGYSNLMPIVKKQMRLMTVFALAEKPGVFPLKTGVFGQCGQAHC